MSALKKKPASVGVNGGYRRTPALLQPARLSSEKVKRFVAELEVPFEPSLIVWRVMNVSEDGTRGEIAPYGNPRAYTDRLNQLFTPAGWTRKYAVTTSPNFERSRDQKTVAKVFVTCDLTIFGIGSHSATGEEWADDDNAATGAEAQAFKRACSCFGLGRYLYDFSGIWVDLDDRQHPRETPQIHGWATPEGWRKGLRPPQRDDSEPSSAGSQRSLKKVRTTPNKPNKRMELIQQIEAMAERVGKPMYRGLLKKVAKVWKPRDIHDTGVLKKVLLSMQTAERGFSRLEAARTKIAPEGMDALLDSLNLKSVEEVTDLGILDKILSAVEEKAAQLEAS